MTNNRDCHFCAKVDGESVQGRNIAIPEYKYPTANASLAMQLDWLEGVD